MESVRYKSVNKTSLGIVFIKEELNLVYSSCVRGTNMEYSGNIIRKYGNWVCQSPIN